jgi:hypothetical protein
MEPRSNQLYKFVAVVNLGFGKFTVFRGGVGSSNDSGFHKISFTPDFGPYRGSL